MKDGIQKRIILCFGVWSDKAHFDPQVNDIFMNCLLIQIFDLGLLYSVQIVKYLASY